MAAFHFEIRSPFSLSDIHCDFDLPSVEQATLEAGRIANESGHDGENVRVTVRDDGGDTVCDVTSRPVRDVQRASGPTSDGPHRYVH